MATTSEIAQQIDRELRIAERELLDLPDLAADWADARSHDEERWLADWSGRELEWRETVVRFESLSGQYRDGLMSDNQARSYRRLVTLLKENIPLLKRWQWMLPLVAIDSLDQTSTA